MSDEKKVNANPEKKAKKDGFFAKVRKWFRELRSELKKVTWPSKKQVINNTWVALVVMAVCAVGIWCFDYIAQLAVKTLISLVG